MKYRIFIAVLAFLLTTTAVLAQPPGRGGGGRGEGGDRGRGRGGGGFEGTLKSWDANGDGYVTKDEAPERAWGFLQRRLEQSGMKASDKIKISDFVAAQEDRERDRDRDRSSDRRRREEPATPGFTTADDQQKVQGFAESSSDSRSRSSRDSSRSRSEEEGYRERAENYARSLIRRYDRNDNQILEKDEWRRISGEPEKADSNKDGVITFEELSARLEFNYRKRDNESSSSGRSRDRSSDARERRDPRSSSKKEEKANSYRLKTAYELWASEAPSWFRERDKDQDGQLAMHEMSRSWTDSRAKTFARYDKNGDGMLSVDEAPSRAF